MLIFIKASAGYDMIDKIKQEAGLNCPDIVCTMQDRHGVVYVGTKRGAYMFDGLMFRKFPPYELEKGVNKILSDNDTLYLITDIGIYAVDRNTLMVRVLEKGVRFTDACILDDGSVLLLPWRGKPMRMDRVSGKITPVVVKHGQWPQSSHNLCMSVDENGNAYIGHQGEGMTVYSLTNQRVKRYTNSHDGHGLPGNEVMDILTDSHGRTWVATHWGLALMNRSNGTFTIFKHNPSNPSSLSESDIHALREINGKLWIGTWRSGVNVLDLHTANLNVPSSVNFTHIGASDLPSGLSSTAIVDIFDDSFGNVWMATPNNGLNVISHAVPFFHTIAYSPLRDDSNSLSDNAAFCMCAYGNSLWIGSEKGNVDVYKRRENKMAFDKVSTLRMSGGITSLCADRRGNVWMGIDKRGLVRYNVDNRSTTDIALGSDKTFRTDIFNIVQDREGKMWICTNNGLFVCDANSKKAVQVKCKGLTVNEPVFSVGEDQAGRLWAWADGKTVVMTPQQKQVGQLQLKGDNINDIFKDSRGTLWVATTEGLIMAKRGGKGGFRLVAAEPQGSLHDVNVFSIAESADGNLWMSTSKGIVRYSLKDNKVDIYDWRDGIHDEEFKPHKAVKIGSSLFFLQQKSVCYFDTSVPMPRYDLPLHTSQASVLSPQTMTSATRAEFLSSQR